MQYLCTDPKNALKENKNIRQVAKNNKIKYQAFFMSVFMIHKKCQKNAKRKYLDIINNII